MFNISWRLLTQNIVVLRYTSFQHLKGDYKKEEDGFFSKVCCDRTMGNVFKLEGLI